MTTPTDKQVTRTELRMAAADGLFRAKIDEFLARLFIAAPDEREMARVSALAAFEAVLDMHEEKARLLLTNMGIDPEWRHAQ